MVNAATYIKVLKDCLITEPGGLSPVVLSHPCSNMSRLCIQSWCILHVIKLGSCVETGVAITSDVPTLQALKQYLDTLPSFNYTVSSDLSQLTVYAMPKQLAHALLGFLRFGNSSTDQEDEKAETYELNNVDKACKLFNIDYTDLSNASTYVRIFYQLFALATSIECNDVCIKSGIQGTYTVHGTYGSETQSNDVLEALAGYVLTLSPLIAVYGYR